MGLSVERSVDGVMTIIMDFEPVNSIATPLRSALLRALVDADQDTGVRAVVLTGAGATFSAGADLNEFDAGRAFDYPSFHSVVLPFIHAMRKPVVAAVNGSALGGGLELALWCHARVAVADAKIGLPETALGLLPGAGGTQLLPRAVGLERATELIVAGAVGRAGEFQGTELVQIIASPAELLAQARGLALQLAAGGAPWPHLGDKKVEHDNPQGFLQFARRQAKARRDFSPGMLAAIDAIAMSLHLPLLEGSRREFELFRGLVDSPEARAIRYGFFARRAAPRVPDLGEAAQALDIERVAVVGAGYMGQGIAQCLAQAGFDVAVHDADPAVAQRAVERLRATPGLQNARLRVADSLADLAGVDLVIEAVLEDIELKKKIFKELDAVAGARTILATNTSTLDIDVIAAATGRPENVLGLHFFGPAPAMALIEVVRGAGTSDRVLATGVELARRVRKTPIVSRVAPGFIANRVYVRLMEQALNLAAEGYEPHTVDAALEAWGWRMGPFRTMDLIGLDVLIKARLPGVERTPGDALMDRLAQRNELGQKSGMGWYEYTPAGRVAGPNPRIRAWLPALPGGLDPNGIAERCLVAMANEGARVLDEGVAVRASDIDLCFVLGYGLSRLKGGPMFQAEELGLARVLQKLLHLHQETGDASWMPSPLLVERAGSSGSFMAA